MLSATTGRSLTKGSLVSLRVSANVVYLCHFGLKLLLDCAIRVCDFHVLICVHFTFIVCVVQIQRGAFETIYCWETMYATTGRSLTKGPLVSLRVSANVVYATTGRSLTKGSLVSLRVSLVD